MFGLVQTDLSAFCAKPSPISRHTPASCVFFMYFLLFPDSMMHFQTVSVSRAAEQPTNKGNQDVDLHYVPIDQYLDMKINGC